ncbi:hypothetical protein [Adhaeribacter aquaticus]|uniref:hypothetical protein n=1 Tax=Adhaeribacter aquaticus TaxID=299567 RepID=UPI00047AD65A|nr:hypothetical protein [Adhaeribacter aquaticus]
MLLVFVSCKKTKDETPSCLLTEINTGGLNYILTYDGANMVAIGNGTSTGALMHYNASGQMIQQERPLENPYTRFTYTYNNSGKVAKQITYFKEGPDWVYKGKVQYKYTDKQLTSIQEESTFNTSGTIYSYDITWTSGNLTTLTSRIGSQVLCNYTYSYNLKKKNNLNAVSDLYFIDLPDNFVKLPFYLSTNLLTKADSNCSGTSNLIRLFTYTLDEKGLIRNVYEGNQPIWKFAYTCN